MGKRGELTQKQYSTILLTQNSTTISSYNFSLTAIHKSQFRGFSLTHSSRLDSIRLDSTRLNSSNNNPPN